MKLSEAVEFAQQSPWLARQSSDFRAALAKRMRLLTRRQGELLFHADDEAPDIVCLVKGSAASLVVHPIMGPFVAVLWGPGQWIGQSPVLGNRRRLLSVEIRADSQFIAISRGAIAEMIEVMPSAAWAFFDLLAIDFEMSVLHGSDMFISDSRVRLYSRLLTLAGRTATHLPVPPVTLLLSKEELAAASGVSRQTVHMFLVDLVELGICRLGYRKIEILDPEALSRLIMADRRSGMSEIQQS